VTWSRDGFIDSENAAGTVLTRAPLFLLASLVRAIPAQTSLAGRNESRLTSKTAAIRTDSESFRSDLAATQTSSQYRFEEDGMAWTKPPKTFKADTFFAYAPTKERLRADSRNLNPTRKTFAGRTMFPIPMDASYASC
jgi:hypothetical protein